MARLEDVRQKAERLGALRERRKQLDAEILMLESELDRLGPKSRTAAGTTAALMEKIIDAVDHSVEPLPMSHFELLLPEAPKATVRAVLSKLERTKKIRRVKRGVYGSVNY